MVHVCIFPFVRSLLLSSLFLEHTWDPNNILVSSVASYISISILFESWVVKKKEKGGGKTLHTRSVMLLGQLWKAATSTCCTESKSFDSEVTAMREEGRIEMEFSEKMLLISPWGLDFLTKTLVSKSSLQNFAFKPAWVEFTKLYGLFLTNHSRYWWKAPRVWRKCYCFFRQCACHHALLFITNFTG